MGNSDSIKLTSPSKQFQYANLSRHINNIKDVKRLRKMLLVYVKLYMRHEELVSDLHSHLRKKI